MINNGFIMSIELFLNISLLVENHKCFDKNEKSGMNFGSAQGQR